MRFSVLVFIWVLAISLSPVKMPKGFAMELDKTSIPTQSTSPKISTKSNPSDSGKSDSSDRSRSSQSRTSRSSSSSSDRNKSRSRSTPNNAIRGGTGQKQTATQSRPSSRSSGSRKGKGATLGEPPTLSYPLGALKTCLYFSPLDVQVKPGEKFEVYLMMRNLSSDAADKVQLTLRYDTQWVTLEDVDLSPLEPYIGNNMEKMKLRRKPGNLFFESPLEKPFGLATGAMMVLHFQAADVTGFSRLEFVYPPEGFTRLLANGENILGSADQNIPGVVPAHIIVSRKENNELKSYRDSETATSTLEEQALASQMEYSMFDAETTDALKQRWLRVPEEARVEINPYLLLQGPEQATLLPGDDFWLDLVLINQDMLPIESLGVKLLFDPQALEVIDEDQENWIVRGINVWDGAFHEAYPFDFHKTNKANNFRGIVEYEAARQYGAWPLPSGIFARVHFRVKKPVGETAIRLDWEEKNKRPASYIRSYGINRLSEWTETYAAPRVELYLGAPDLAREEERAGIPLPAM